MGYCRPQGLPDESVPASAFTNHRGNHRGVGAGTSVRLTVFSLMAVPGTRATSTPNCVTLVSGEVFSRSMP